MEFAGKMTHSMRLFLPRGPVPDSLSGGEPLLPMHYRLIVILAIVCFAFGGGGCASKSGDYEEVLMPLQTGSVLQRRVLVKTDRRTKPKKTKKKPAASPKPETEPQETPAPQEESTPPPERFR
jgi:hypothetical protein